MPRVIWKGAISFGLVHVPVALYPASQEIGIDFDWLDKRTMDPVGYKRVNKRTGKEIERDDIVKGIKQDDGEYVVLSDEEIKAAYPKSTQTIEIEAFVQADRDPLHLPREALLPGAGRQGREGLRAAARGDGRGRRDRRRAGRDAHQGAAGGADPGRRRAAAQHHPLGRARSGRATRSSLPAEGKGADKPEGRRAEDGGAAHRRHDRRVEAERLWRQFTAAIHALAAQRVEAGKTEKVTPLEDAGAAPGPSNVVDLTDLLRKSLATRKPGAESKAERGGASPARKSAAKKATPARSSKAAPSSSSKSKRAA